MPIDLSLYPPRWETIARAIERHALRFTNETGLQNCIASLLSAESISFEREYRLTSSDRLDFFCDGCIIETKVKDSLAAVTRQLHRYAQHDSVQSLLLVTTRSAHRGLPFQINTKPVHVVWLGRNNF